MPRGHPGLTVKQTKTPKQIWTLHGWQPDALQKALEQPRHRLAPVKGGGRPKGSPNKISRDLKEAYLLAANFAGGKEGWLAISRSRLS